MDKAGRRRAVRRHAEHHRRARGAHDARAAARLDALARRRRWSRRRRAAARRPSASSTASRRIYTPLVFAAALLLATVPLLFGGDAGTWLYRALALLIVACPCSLVISVPVAVVSAVGGAARRGILIKGGQALEDLGRVRAVALDKTGTLTLGLPQLQRVAAADDEPRALALVAAVEAGSEHPLPPRCAARPATAASTCPRPRPSKRSPAAAPRRASRAATCGPADRG